MFDELKWRYEILLDMYRGKEVTMKKELEEYKNAHPLLPVPADDPNVGKMIRSKNSAIRGQYTRRENKIRAMWDEFYTRLGNAYPLCTCCPKMWQHLLSKKPVVTIWTSTTNPEKSMNLQSLRMKSSILFNSPTTCRRSFRLVAFLIYAIKLIGTLHKRSNTMRAHLLSLRRIYAYERGCQRLPLHK